MQKGQTVSDLQLRGLVSRHTLETANPGVDFENLRVGQSVCIPKDNVPCELPETYTLAATETLEAVAMRFNLPVASLLRANPCLAPQDFEGGRPRSFCQGKRSAGLADEAGHQLLDMLPGRPCAESSSSSGAGGSSTHEGPRTGSPSGPSASCMS